MKKKLIIFSAALLTVSFMYQTACPPEAAALSKVWTRTYNGPGNSDDEADGAALTPQGDLYVAGTTIAGTNHNIWLGKYSPGGRLKWSKTFDDENNGIDHGWDVATDGQGNAYVTGHITVPGQSSNLWLGKYSPKGKLRWSRDYNDPNVNGGEIGLGVAVDREKGVVYVCGNALGAVFGTNFLLIKYSARGKRKWVRLMSYGTSDSLNDVAVAPGGAVYAVGSGQIDGQGSNLAVVKYTARGKFKWMKTFNGPDDKDDQGRGIAVGLDGNIYVSGVTTLEKGGFENDDVFLRKYTPRGKKVWTRKLDGKDSLHDRNYGVAAGPTGVYVVGNTDTETPGAFIWLAKYSLAGNLLWTKGYNKHQGAGYGIAPGSGGELYVAGTIFPSGQSRDIWLRKYQE